MAWKDQGWRADTEGMSPSEDALLPWGPCSSFPKTPPRVPSTAAHPRPHPGLWNSLLNLSSRETPTRARGLGGLKGLPTWSLEAPRESACAQAAGAS